MDKDLQQVKERIVDAIELFELAEEVYFGNRHAPLGIDEVSEDGIHSILSALCVPGACVVLWTLTRKGRFQPFLSRYGMMASPLSAKPKRGSLASLRSGAARRHDRRELG